LRADFTTFAASILLSKVMAEENSKFNDFLEKIKFKYRVSITNEDTLEELRQYHLSRLSMFLIVSSFAVICFIIISLIILYSPLRGYLPGYTDTKARTELIHNVIRIDSLSNQLEMQQQYLDAVRSVISGEIKLDSITPIDSIVKLNTEHILLEKSEKEQEFIDNYEGN
jgi:hypothetical protein